MSRIYPAPDVGNSDGDQKKSAPIVLKSEADIRRIQFANDIQYAPRASAAQLATAEGLELEGSCSGSSSLCMSSIEDDIVNFFSDRQAAARLRKWVKSKECRNNIDRCCIRTVKDRFLCTPFQAAVIQYRWHQRFDLLDLLLDADADINVTEVTTGCTAIVMTAQSKIGHPELVHYLLECGANPLIVDHQGQNALNAARSYKIFPLLIPYYQDAAMLDMMMLRKRKDNYARSAFSSFARSRRMSFHGRLYSGSSVRIGTLQPLGGFQAEFQAPSDNRSKRSWVSLIPVEDVRQKFTRLMTAFAGKPASTRFKKNRNEAKFWKESQVALKHAALSDPIEILVQSTQKFASTDRNRLRHSTQSCDIRLLGREVHFTVEIDHLTCLVTHKFESRVKTIMVPLMNKLDLDERDFFPFLAFLLSYVDVNYSRRSDLTRFDVIFPLILRNDLAKGSPLRYHWFPGVVRSWLWNPSERERVFDWMSWHRKY